MPWRSTAVPGAGFPRADRAGIVIKDAIADVTLQQVLTRPDNSTSSPRRT